MNAPVPTPTASKNSGGIFGFGSKPQTPESQSPDSQSPILWGAAAAAALGLFNAKIEERKRKEREKANRYRHSDHYKRKFAEKEGRLWAYLREKRRERAKRAEAKAERMRRNDARRKEKRRREKSGLSDKEWKHRKELEAIWNANGAALYEAKKAARKERKQTRRERVRATSASQKDDPYAGMEDWYEKQDRINAEMMDEIPELQAWAKKEKAIKAQKDAELDSATRSYMAMGAAVEANKFEQAEGNQPDSGKYQGDVLADYMEAQQWRDENALEALEYGLQPSDSFPVSPSTNGTSRLTRIWQNIKKPFQKISLTETDSYTYLKSQRPPSWLSISAGPSIERDLFSSEYVGWSPGTGGFWKRFFFEQQTVKVSSSETGTQNSGAPINLNLTSGKLTLSLGKGISVFGQPGSATAGFSITQKSSPDAIYYSKDTFALDLDWMSTSWITAHSDIRVNNNLSDDTFKVTDTDTVTGKVRKIKGAGPLLILAGVVAFLVGWEVAPILIPAMPKLGELLSGVGG